MLESVLTLVNTTMTLLRKYISIAMVSALLLALLLGCSGGVKPQQFAGTTPKFVLEDYFRGKTKAWGVVHNRSGRLVRQFTVDMDGEWDGKELTLTEDFVYADGKKEQRIWRIRKIDEHHYEGRADDVVGVAKGYQYGQALYWTYDLNLDVDGSTYQIHFDDWMYHQPGSVVINRAEMSKYGFNVGEVVLFFSKDEVDTEVE